MKHRNEFEVEVTLLKPPVQSVRRLEELFIFIHVSLHSYKTDDISLSFFETYCLSAHSCRICMHGFGDRNEEIVTKDKI